MKRLVFLVLACMAMVVRAQIGTSCTNPYVVDHNFETYIPAGTHWFTAGTHDLPLYVTFEPDTFLLDFEKYSSEDEFFADIPGVTIDFGCDGQYDETAELVIALAAAAGYEIPMETYMMPMTLDSVYIVDYEQFYIRFDGYTQDSLLFYMPFEGYEEAFALAGLTQNIPAYIKFTTTVGGMVTLNSKSVMAQCEATSVRLHRYQEQTIKANDTTSYYFMPENMLPGNYLGLNFYWQADDTARVYLSTTCQFEPSEETYSFTAQPNVTTLAMDSLELNGFVHFTSPFLFYKIESDVPGVLTLYNQDDVVLPEPPVETGMQDALASALKTRIEGNKVMVESEIAQDVVVFTPAGVVVQRFTIGAGKQHSFTLPAGIYFMRGENENEVKELLVY